MTGAQTVMSLGTQMQISRMGALLLAAGLSLLVTGCTDLEQREPLTEVDTAASSSSLPYYDSQDFTPRWVEPGSTKLDAFHTISDFSFTNQDGNLVNSDTLDGKIYVASFFFSTCPGICSPVNLNLMLVQDKFLDDDQVRILSHTITPEIDTVPVLKSYAEKRQIDSRRWDLVTGDKDTIFALAKQGYFAHEDMGKSDRPGDLQHTENIVLVDQSRHIRGVYNGLSGRAMFDLIADIELLKAELSPEAIP